ncbi:hypothetical protein AURDEDRAFT_166905 [Auricularia subglabra TFB-10046 SS5]|nr:hypothetical protein AURDEDRAFT_166905 [Auricularia subglabra TFB-10046 SS5]
MKFDKFQPKTRQASLGVIQGRPIYRRAQGIDKFPPELLREVFQYTAFSGDKDDIWWDLAKPAGKCETVTKALRLAGVSKTWRTVAKDTGVIWSYISVPDPTTWQSISDIADLLTRILNRSGTASLSILLPWDTDSVHKLPAGFFSCAAQDVFEVLCQHADRWQRFKYEAPADGVGSAILRLIFARPTPSLQFVDVSNTHRAVRSGGATLYSTTVSGLLPASPLLEIAHLGLENFCALDTPAAALVHLTVDSPLMHIKLWEILECTPNLQTLSLWVSGNSMAGPREAAAHSAMLDNPIVLASLRRLDVTSYLLNDTLGLAADYIRTPNLVELHLPHSLLWEEDGELHVQRFLAVNGEALTTLVVREDKAAYVFADCGLVEVDTFWKKMSRAPWLAPRLKELFMFDIIDIPGLDSYWAAFKAFKEVRMNPPEGVAYLAVTAAWTEQPGVPRKHVLRARLRHGMGILMGHKMWQ